MKHAYVRRGLACLALVSLVTVAAGCGDDSDDDASTPVEETTEEPTLDPVPEGLVLVEDGTALPEGTEIQQVASAQESSRMLDLVNATRRAGKTCGRVRYGPAPALTLNAKVATAAEVHALDMVTKNFFSHTGSNGTQPWDRVTKAGYAWKTVGENIAAGNAAADATVAQWFASAGHCANFMNKAFTVVGFGKAYSATSQYKTYWVAVLAAPK